ncbi:MAG: TetM/TetW/TetO/TetS family tetracycline resistance ribosomal protection protein [Clostridia bacterium]|nr:TetM/TetW/TetO/TetS family tetracycline resistance ribosomal protection protein [Clostridia bacterium]
MKKLTIGIIAHVDSGKTTLSEAILYKTGILHKLGSVNKGDSHLDTNEIERDRGITIFSSGANFTCGDIEFTLLDTPGHVDFSPETERVLRVIDCAVLVISGTDGVQSHTVTLWRLLESYHIPTVIFINKMDITALAHRELMEELKYKLGDGCVDFCAMTLESFSDELAMCDETLMESYVSGEKFKNEDIQNAVGARRLFPCFFGSALKGDGINLLLDGLTKYVSIPEYGNDFGAKVYKITQDKSDKVVHIKLTGGVLKVKDTISGTSPDGTPFSEKINQIRIYSGEKFKTVNEVTAGTICALTGVSGAYPGQGFGFEKDSGAAHLEPVLSYRVDLPGGIDIHTALMKFRRLEEEEPALHIIYNERRGEIYFGIMGEVQLEVLTRIIKERFGMDVTFSDGSIAYRETIRSATVGIGHYEPLRHYAEVQLLLEPLPRGEGIRFAVDGECALEGNYKRLVLSHLYEKTHIGALTGSPITDVKITLIAGRAHAKHTEGGDFRQATWRAVRQGLRSAECVLLEPWYDFRLEVPAESIGRAMTDITQMGGRFGDPETFTDGMVLAGSAPVAKMRGYHRELVGYTKGSGKLFTSLRGYEECKDAETVIAESGYDADRDVENTADSVFCDHGAGFVVKWDDVPSYKHLDSGVELDTPDEEEVETRVQRYMRIVADNEELMRIFEKTYGPIKKRNFNEPKVKSAVPQKKPRPHSSGPSLYSGSEYLLIDGYNIIYAWDDLRALSEKSLDLARGELINRICNYRGLRNCDIIIVFDAYKVKRNPGEVEKHAGITVVYTKEAETADTYIERASHELAKTHRVRVATSDGQEQLIILGSGAIRVSANGLRAEVEEAERQIREYIGG